jgi:hypothetical protein
MYAPVNYPYPQQVNKSSVIALLMAGRRARHGYSRMLPERAVKDYRSPTQSPENNKIKDLQAMTG